MSKVQTVQRTSEGMNMNKNEFRAKLLEELRSGEHRQCRGRMLSHDGSMCCLGVAAKVVLGLPVVAWDSETGEGVLNSSKYDKVKLLMGARLGLKAIKMNDDGHSFSEIANYLESKWAKSAVTRRKKNG